jgi:hypothetical protein
MIMGNGLKSITSPNSPRAQAIKQIKRTSDKSNGSYGGIAEIQALDEINVGLLSEKLTMVQ